MSNKKALTEEEIIRFSAEDVRRKWEATSYYDRAEKTIDHQLSTYILPLINKKKYDFSRTLELAPGHGRNTNILKKMAKEIHLVDANKTCINYCKERFKNYRGPCRFFYYVNDGYSLSQIAAGIMTFIYSWDSMVHFEKSLMRAYLKEFHRVLKPSGYGLVHHSNYGSLSEKADIKIQNNPHWRSNMSAKLFIKYCSDIGLQIEEQRIIQWGTVKDLDCISVFRKVENRDQDHFTN